MPGITPGSWNISKHLCARAPLSADTTGTCRLRTLEYVVFWILVSCSPGSEPAVPSVRTEEEAPVVWEEQAAQQAFCSWVRSWTNLSGSRTPAVLIYQDHWGHWERRCRMKQGLREKGRKAPVPSTWGKSCSSMALQRWGRRHCEHSIRWQ